jgi:hypothetical protein
MATTRPWVTPTQVKEYTDFQKVKDRTDPKLEVDIRRSENAIIEYLNRDFTEIDPETGEKYIDPNTGLPYVDIPLDVIDATIILAESIALNAISSSRAEGLQSEDFDDYSYKRFSMDDFKWVTNLNLGPNLNRYILDAGSGKRTVLKLRRL